MQILLNIKQKINVKYKKKNMNLLDKIFDTEENIQ